MIRVQTVQPEEFEVFWALRLEALQNNPEAFGSTYEESVKTPLADVKNRLNNDENSFVVGAYTDEGKLIGMFGFKREQGLKSKHKGFIWGVYVKPEYRGEGIARMLLEDVIRRSKALEDLRQINLAVVTTNVSAKRLYQSVGFETIGLEKCALFMDGQYYDEELMTLFLNS
ncbi:GNAT family N-acetyltransferase [Paenibacillus sp. KN14-4R]|uniref:GNAT family N-acetyltransferase n=1 Tax=Paenibacillus sp. KN14-4R TaxID=3445773 RepID=UPI003F9FB0A6